MTFTATYQDSSIVRHGELNVRSQGIVKVSGWFNT